MKYLRFAGIATLLLLSFAGSAQKSTVAGFSMNDSAGCSPLIVHFQDLSTGNPDEWVWDLGNGSISQERNPTTTYFSPGKYTIKLIVRNGNAVDTIIKSQVITVYQNPDVKFNVSDSGGCLPLSVHFLDETFAGSGSVVQWSWDFGDGTISNQQTPSHLYTIPGSYNVTLKAINTYGCQKTITRSKVVKVGNLLAEYNVAINSDCNSPVSAQFVSTTQGAISYFWDFGDGATSNISNPLHNYAISGAYSVKLVVWSAYGCKDSLIKQIRIDSSKIDFKTPAACESTPLSFLGTSSLSPTSVKWTFGDGTSSTQLNPVKTYNTAGTYTVKLVADFGGCKDSITRMVTVHPKPEVSFVATPTNACSLPAVVSFNAVSTSDEFHWDFGDGSTSDQKSPVHTYTLPGNFDVQLVAKSEYGCATAISKVAFVKISPPEILSITGALYQGCTPYNAEFSAKIQSAKPVQQWLWTFGDGTTSTEESPIHLFNDPGVYSVQLIIITTDGCSDTMNIYQGIRISNKPSASFIATPLVTCAAGPISFANSSTGAEVYFWDFGDNGFSSEKNPVHQFGDTGLFTIKLVASVNGCSDTLIKKNYVRNDPPIGRFNIIQNCVDPYNVQFRDSSIGGQNYKWYFGDGDSSIEKYPVHRYQMPGVYEVSLIVYHGSCSYRATSTVSIVDELPLLKIGDSVICRNEQITFASSGANPANINNYRWLFGNGDELAGAAATVIYNYTGTGQFHPALIVTDILGCKDTLNGSPVTVFGPKASYTTIEGTCVNTLVQFADSSKTDGIHKITTRYWNYGDGSTAASTNPTVSHVYTQSGTYRVTLRVIDSYGCVDSIQAIPAIQITRPVADFAQIDSVKCSLNNVAFSNKSSGVSLQYDWNFSDGSASVEKHTVHTYATPGDYPVSLRVTDRFGCKDSITRNQRVSDPFASFIASDSFASCPPLLVSLTNAASSFSKVRWDFGDNSSADITDPSHYYTHPGSYKLTMKVQGFGNCIDSATKTIVVKGPTGTLGFSPDTVCTKEQVQFNATAPANSTILWDFSDGVTNVSQTKIGAHRYQSPGLYRPRMILIDTAGCQVPIESADTLTVMGVRAGIGSTQALFCDSAILQFRDSSEVLNDLPVQFKWKFGDGSTSTQRNPVHVFRDTGVFMTYLTVVSAAGCTDSIVSPNTIQIVRSPSIKIHSKQGVCQLDSIQFSGTFTPEPQSLSWNWVFPEGKGSTLQNPSESFSSQGNHRITAVATNESGCADTANIDILVHPLPQVNAGTDTMICRGNSYFLQPKGAANYKWQYNSSLTELSDGLATARPIEKVVYYVTGTTEFGCKARDSVTVQVMQPFTVTVSHPDTLCAGQSVQLRAEGAAKYQWYPAEGLNNTGLSNPIANPVETTDYTVIASDALKCFTDTSHVLISVFPVPKFNIIESALTVPVGNDVPIHTSSSQDVRNWRWFPSKGLNCDTCAEPMLHPTENITYTAVASNNGGCFVTDKLTVTVVCNGGNIFIPNTFSPNNDGMNDIFYPRAKGVSTIRSMRIFNRWGDLLFEKNNFSVNDPDAGWNGMFKGSILTPDVFVYTVDVICENSTVFTLKGNVTLIR